MGAKNIVRIGLAVFVTASLIAMNARHDIAVFIAKVSRQTRSYTLR